MENQNEINQKLQAIANKLVEVINDSDIKVSVNKNKRVISFLEYSFSIPDPKDKINYISTWEEIFSYFEDAKNKLEVEVVEEEIITETPEEEQLGYTQNLSYIQSIIEKNSPVESSEPVVEHVKEETDPGFTYGVRISEDDVMNESDWFDFEEAKTEFIILCALKNGKTDRKFKNHIKKCRDHELNAGVFFSGTSLNLSDAKKELVDIESVLEIFKIEGPVIYEINNKAIAEFENTGDNVSKETIKSLSAIVEGCKYIINALKEKGYPVVLNVDLSTISVLANINLLSPDELPLIYNVLPGQSSKLDDSCQFIEFNPKTIYERVKLNSILLNKQTV